MGEQQTRANCSTVPLLKCQKYFVKQNHYLYHTDFLHLLLLLPWPKTEVFTEYHLQRNQDKWCGSSNRTSCHQNYILQSSRFYLFQISCYLLKDKSRELMNLFCVGRNFLLLHLSQCNSLEKSLLQIHSHLFIEIFSLFLKLLSFCMKTLSHFKEV